MTPNKPYKHVEAPALIVVVLHNAENMLPTIAVTRYIIAQFNVPNVY